MSGSGHDIDAMHCAGVEAIGSGDGERASEQWQWQWQSVDEW